jgi:hypothetical protein
VMVLYVRGCERLGRSPGAAEADEEAR